MREFFRYEDTIHNKDIYHSLNFFEWIIPIIVLFVLIGTLLLSKEIIKQSIVLDQIIKYAMVGLLTFFFAIHYILKWITEGGIQLRSLPLQLCSVSMFLTILLVFTNKKIYHSFIMFTGVLGGVGSLILPMVGYSYEYFRYYQFMISHILIVIIPIYYTVIHGYVPTFKGFLKTFTITQIFAVIMLIFNTYYNTDYLYISLNKDYLNDNSLVHLLGGSPWYLINVEVFGTIIFFVWYGVVYYLFDKKENNININIPVYSERKA